MGYFPFYVDIENKEGLIVGGGRIAAHKIGKLLPFNPRLIVVAPYIQEDLKNNASLQCHEREVRDEDVAGKAFVIAATDNESVNARISRLCREQNILVNVVDDKEKCSFIFPSIVKKGKITASFSTEGASPHIAATLRKKIEGEIPDNMEEILDFLTDIRAVAKNQIQDSTKRSAFLKNIADICFEQKRILTKEETEELIKSYKSL